MEDLIADDGKIVTSTLGEYKLPNIADIPPLRTLLFQDHDGPGPFHSKPVGEHSAVPTAACIANAVYDAIGTPITDLPLTAERIYAAMKKQQSEREAIKISPNPSFSKRGTRSF
jgi:CO/xanthine dehydrogenase Mo-binding subunit